MSRIFLIDGYNVIKSLAEFKAKSLEDGRYALIRFISSCRPHGSARNGVTVVFDGQPGVWSPEVSGEVKVQFSCGETADDVIKRRVEDSPNKSLCVVVTDDRALLYYCRSLGAEVWSVASFFLQGHKEELTGARRRQDMRERSGEPKVISRVLESRINREMEERWLTPKTKHKGK
ncbi:MAG: NYN domain-containing protein [Candidatus Omnitrophica bacterium]|nr:NYN domain-containing protein [Candidatus Omnitrophota bacterium]